MSRWKFMEKQILVYQRQVYKMHYALSECTEVGVRIACIAQGTMYECV